MRVLYGVVGEGMGHALRSQVVIDHLIARGHRVRIVSSQRAADYLARRYSGVHRIHGFFLRSKNNRVQRLRTLGSNLWHGALALPRQIGAYADVLEEFEPEAVISDFDSWTYGYAKAHRLPVFSIDNAQSIHRCAHPSALIAGQESNFRLARSLVAAKLPRCDHYFVLSFVPARVTKERTSVHAPVLRPEILRARPKSGEHLLVYQTSEGYYQLAAALREIGLECRVYGMRRRLEEEVVDGNLRYRPFDAATFAEDLRSARAVITGGGFTTISEALHLGKAVLSIPVEKNFEQILNARYLAHQGFGECAPAASVEVLHRFLRNVERYSDAVSMYPRQGNNSSLLSQLDSFLHVDEGSIARRLISGKEWEQAYSGVLQ